MLDRAYGALVGGAIGDAMGMPASFLTRAQIEKSYGYIHDFLEPEKDVQSYHGNLQAAEITDDTMESVIISDILIADGEFRDGVQSRHEKMGGRAENAGEHSDRTFHPEISDGSHRRQRP